MFWGVSHGFVPGVMEQRAGVKVTSITELKGAATLWRHKIGIKMNFEDSDWSEVQRRFSIEKIYSVIILKHQIKNYISRSQKNQKRKVARKLVDQSIKK